ncbi:MAG: prolipoprotein diacylglyceryl transferase [Clostridia bacterium]|nr:prolipoprotein diacylglyceryl transferase [Clostridia bacterium]
MVYFLYFLGLVINYILNFIQLNKVKNRLIISIITLACIILGSKILDYIVNYRFYEFYNFEEVLKNGYMIYGGIITAIVEVNLYCYLNKIETKKVFDVIIPNMLIMYSIFKIGCFINGCCIGKYDIPIQLIESIVCFIVYRIINKYFNNDKISVTCIGFGFIRILDFIMRKQIMLDNLIINEIISIFILVFGIYYYRKNNQK